MCLCSCLHVCLFFCVYVCVCMCVLMCFCRWAGRVGVGRECLLANADEDDAVKVTRIRRRDVADQEASADVNKDPKRKSDHRCEK